jgi:sugar phosphate isomerase/epimerase
VRADQIAVQLYPLRDLLRDDVQGTLRSVAGAGYRAVELVGLPAMPAERLRDLLAAAGLRPMGAHVSLEAMRRDLAGELQRAAVLDCPRLIVPWLPQAERSTVDGVRRLADEMATIGERIEAAGSRLGYHNHDFEFAALDGTTIWQVLLDALPETVDLELDVYWATVAGMDPVELIEAARGRIRMLHMKDKAAGADGRDVAPGDGILPWPSILDAGARSGVQWYVVEKDDTTNALADVTRARRFLHDLAASRV